MSFRLERVAEGEILDKNKSFALKEGKDKDLSYLRFLTDPAASRQSLFEMTLLRRARCFSGNFKAEKSYYDYVF